MNNAHGQDNSSHYALRSSNADSFIMDMAHTYLRGAARQTPVRDSHPLRRQVSRYRDMDEWVSNENMCVALWALMSRS